MKWPKFYHSTHALPFLGEQSQQTINTQMDCYRNIRKLINVFEQTVLKNMDEYWKEQFVFEGLPGVSLDLSDKEKIDNLFLHELSTVIYQNTHTFNTNWAYLNVSRPKITNNNHIIPCHLYPKVESIVRRQAEGFSPSAKEVIFKRLDFYLDVFKHLNDFLQKNLELYNKNILDILYPPEEEIKDIETKQKLLSFFNLQTRLPKVQKDHARVFIQFGSLAASILIDVTYDQFMGLKQQVRRPSMKSSWHKIINYSYQETSGSQYTISQLKEALPLHILYKIEENLGDINKPITKPIYLSWRTAIQDWSRYIAVRNNDFATWLLLESI